MVSREEWNALNETGVILPLVQSPVQYVIISHTAMSSCNTTEDCCRAVRDVQIHHFSWDFFDIGYNFLVGGDGCAYVGRGWDYTGAHARLFNNRSIGVSFIGNFENTLPPRKQINAAILLLETGLRTGKIAPNYKLFAHSQVSAVESPGRPLTDQMKTWPHWSEYDPVRDAYKPDSHSKN